MKIFCYMKRNIEGFEPERSCYQAKAQALTNKSGAGRAGERAGGGGVSGQDDAAPPNGGAVNHSFRQTDRRDVCPRTEPQIPLSPYWRFMDLWITTKE